MIDDAEFKRRTKHYLCIAVGDKQSFIRQSDSEKWKERRKEKRKRAWNEHLYRKSKKRTKGIQKKSKYSGRKRSKKF